MGLRKSELLKVTLKNQKNEYIAGIKIFEQKNQHSAIRLIPLSLIKLSKHFGVNYPMTLERLKTVRAFALEKLGIFYNLRHTCITNIVKFLYEGTALARFHTSPKTSLKYYIDLESLPLIDNCFSLEGTENLFTDETLRVN